MPSQKPRILFTVTNDLSFDQRMQRICRTLSNAGFDITLIGFIKDWSVDLAKESYNQKRLSLFFRKGKLFYIEYNLRLFFLLLFSRANVICSIDLDTLGAGWLASRFKKTKLVHDAHEYYSELPEVVSRKIIYFFWSSLESFLLQRIPHNYTVSKTIADALTVRYGQPYRVFPNLPIKRDAQTKVASSQTDYILYQGTLNRGRGLEEAMCATKLESFNLKIAGEGDLSEQLREEGKKYGAQVEFIGYLNPVELRGLTAGAWMGINLLEDQGLSYYYSLSNKFFDYVHAGIPQITMNFPEYRRFNSEFEVAILVDDINPKKIAEVIALLKNDPARYSILKENCKKAREKWNWQAKETELIAFYKQLIEA